jgi:DNA-directed RNA polymerase subunit omega
MLYPSIDKLMEVIDSKYSLVSIAAKRARDLKEDDKPLLDQYVSHKYVGKALEEIYKGALKIKQQD